MAMFGRTLATSHTLSPEDKRCPSDDSKKHRFHGVSRGQQEGEQVRAHDDGEPLGEVPVPRVGAVEVGQVV